MIFLVYFCMCVRTQMFLFAIFFENLEKMLKEKLKKEKINGCKAQNIFAPDNNIISLLANKSA